MTKITLSDVSNPQNLTSLQNTINDNNAILETASDNTLSRDGTGPNQMLSALDMNSFNILNLPAPATSNSPARLIDVVSNPAITVPPVGTSGSTVGLLNSNKTDSGNNTWTGTNNFTNTVTFSSITLPANSVNSSNVVNGSLTGSDLANNTVINNNLALMNANTIKGNNSAIAATPSDLTATQTLNILGAVSNNNATKGSNYTLQSTDNGTTIILGGGAFFTVSATAASGYPSNFICRLVNSDSRGKSIALNGVTTFILWPGQSIFVANLNNGWNYNDPGRWRKAGIQLYVDTANGNDSNDGLAPTSGAFKTINAAYTALVDHMDCQNTSPTINIANGTYTETLLAAGQVTGTNVVFLIGASPSGVIWKPASNICLFAQDNAELEVQNVKFDNSGGAAGAFAVAVHQTGVVDILSGCEFGSFTGGTHMFADHGGGSINLPASYTVSGNAGVHMQIGGACSATMIGGGTVTITGSPTIGVWAQAIGSGANIAFASGTVYSGAPAAGCQKFALSLNASLSLAGTTLPGTVAGAATSGGQFV